MLRKRSSKRSAFLVLSMKPMAEASLVKGASDAPLGLSLAPMADGAPGVIISAMSATVANPTANGLCQGCVIFEVVLQDGSSVQASDHKELSNVLREASGPITLRYAKAALPEGWTEHHDLRKRIFYRNKDKRLTSYSHPLALLDIV